MGFRFCFTSAVVMSPGRHGGQAAPAGIAPHWFGGALGSRGGESEHPLRSLCSVRRTNQVNCIDFAPKR